MSTSWERAEAARERAEAAERVARNWAELVKRFPHSSIIAERAERAKRGAKAAGRIAAHAEWVARKNRPCWSSNPALIPPNYTDRMEKAGR